MLLGSLDVIDSERIAELVEYLVVALLPADAQVLPDIYVQVTET